MNIKMTTEGQTGSSIFAMASLALCLANRASSMISHVIQFAARERNNKSVHAGVHRNQPTRKMRAAKKATPKTVDKQNNSKSEPKSEWLLLPPRPQSPPLYRLLSTEWRKMKNARNLIIQFSISFLLRYVVPSDARAPYSVHCTLVRSAVTFRFVCNQRKQTTANFSTFHSIPLSGTESAEHSNLKFILGIRGREKKRKKWCEHLRKVLFVWQSPTCSLEWRQPKTGGGPLIFLTFLALINRVEK